jgi:hypothetical protein
MIVFAKPCPKCGVDVRSDEEHQCQKSKPARKPTTAPVEKTIASSRNSPSSRRTVSPPEPVSQLATQPVSHPVSLLAKPKRDRTAYQRELMRKRRAAARQKAPE